MLYVDFVASRAHTTYAMCANHGVAVGRSAATVAHTNVQAVFLAFSFGFRNSLCSTTLNMRLNVDAVYM